MSILPKVSTCFLIVFLHDSSSFWSSSTKTTFLPVGSIIFFVSSASWRSGGRKVIVTSAPSLACKPNDSVRRCIESERQVSLPTYHHDRSAPSDPAISSGDDRILSLEHPGTLVLLQVRLALVVPAFWRGKGRPEQGTIRFELCHPKVRDVYCESAEVLVIYRAWYVRHEGTCACHSLKNVNKESHIRWRCRGENSQLRSSPGRSCSKCSGKL